MAFSAGIGENSDVMRAGVAKELEWMGVKLDPEKNKVRSGEPRVISTPDSKIKVLVVPTNEELLIARDTLALISK
jgi:acetate kinase